MTNRSWSAELWDQFDNVSKYTDKSIQFCEKYESFLKDRCTIEDDYAKALRKLTKTYSPKSKEQEEFYNKYSYTIAFCSTLKELQDLAAQHELIAESLRDNTIKKIQLTIKECREQRKKCLDEYNKMKRQLDKQRDLLNKSLKRYEECYESSRRAKEGYDRAHEDLELSRAQLEKSREFMTSKAKLCDEAHINYSSHVSFFNDTQHLFYEQQLPTILSELQQLDGKRTVELQDIYFQFIQSHAAVLPRIQRCLDEMSKQTEQINSYTDSQLVIDEYKSGYSLPNDEKVIDLNSDDLPSLLYHTQDQTIYNEITRSNTLRSTNSDCYHSNGVSTIYAPLSHAAKSQTLTRTPGGTSRKATSAANTIKRLFGNTTQRKYPVNGNTGVTTANAPFGTLPPAQRIRKFQEQILNCKNELEKKQKAKEGLIKMKAVFQENPKFGDQQNVQQQILTLDDGIEKLFAEIKRFEAYISEIERASRVATSNDYDVSLRSYSIYSSDQSISNHYQSTSSHNRSLFYFRQHRYKMMNPVRRWSATVCSPDMTEQNKAEVVDQTSEFNRLPSVTSMTINQTEATVQDANTSFEDEDDDIDRSDNQYQDPLNSIKALVLYDFNEDGNSGSQYVNAASICAGEYVDIIEHDHGDGWTRVKKTDGSIGFVPSSYIRIDAQLSATSRPNLESDSV